MSAKRPKRNPIADYIAKLSASPTRREAIEAIEGEIQSWLDSETFGDAIEELPICTALRVKQLQAAIAFIGNPTTGKRG